MSQEPFDFEKDYQDMLKTEIEHRRKMAQLEKSSLRLSQWLAIFLIISFLILAFTHFSHP